MEKKFLLSRTDKKIAGVCGVLFIVLLLGGSLGFWLYILLWLFAPNRDEA